MCCGESSGACSKLGTFLFSPEKNTFIYFLQVSGYTDKSKVLLLPFPVRECSRLLGKDEDSSPVNPIPVFSFQKETQRTCLQSFLKGRDMPYFRNMAYLVNHFRERETRNAKNASAPLSAALHIITSCSTPVKFRKSQRFSSSSCFHPVKRAIFHMQGKQSGSTDPTVYP